jgi:hypothetical protein
MRTQGHNAAKSKLEKNRGKAEREDPRSVSLGRPAYPFFSPRRPSSSGKPLIQLQVHAPQVHSPETLRTTQKNSCLTSFSKNSRKFITILVLPYTFCAFFYRRETPGRVVCEFVQPWTSSTEGGHDCHHWRRHLSLRGGTLSKSL